MRLKDKIAIVVGAGQSPGEGMGNGRATVLRFVQEARADSAAAKLRAMISVHATVLRDGRPREVPVADLVPGDVVELAAGDMIPADVRLLSCKDLFLTQASLTGEAFPVEKFAAREEAAGRSPLEWTNVCYLGTSVESGAATAVVVATGLTTFLGGISTTLVEQQVPTSFDRGMTRFTWLMIYFILVMVPLVFVVNGLTKGDWAGAFFFAMAVAVGMTPEMLPVLLGDFCETSLRALWLRRLLLRLNLPARVLRWLSRLCRLPKLLQLLRDHPELLPERLDLRRPLLRRSRHRRCGRNRLLRLRLWRGRFGLRGCGVNRPKRVIAKNSYNLTRNSHLLLTRRPRTRGGGPTARSRTARGA